MKLDSSLAPSFLPWMAQQFCVPFAAFLFIALTDAVPRSFSPGVQPSAFIQNSWSTIASWGVGLLLAFLVNRFFPRVAEDGRVIWVLPSIVLMMLICSELFRQDLRHVLTDFFYPPNDSEEGLLFVLLTIPTYSCIAYSIGVVFARAKFPRKRES